MTHPTLKDIFDEAQKLITFATEKGITIATAESCTGGLIGAAITAIPGSSTPFKGGIIAYDNAVKTKLLGVSPSVLGKYGDDKVEVTAKLFEFGDIGRNKVRDITCYEALKALCAASQSSQ